MLRFLLINKRAAFSPSFVVGSLKASIDPPKLQAKVVIPKLKATIKLYD